MKIHLLIIASVFALCVGGCASDSLMSDEEYDEAHTGPAPNAPDPSSHLPARPSDNPLYNGTQRY